MMMMTWCLEGGGLIVQIHSVDAASEVMRSLGVVVAQKTFILLRHRGRKVSDFAVIGRLVTLIA